MFDSLQTLWTIAHQAALSMGFSSKNTGVDCHILLQCIILLLHKCLEIKMYKRNIKGIFWRTYSALFGFVVYIPWFFSFPIFLPYFFFLHSPVMCSFCTVLLRWSFGNYFQLLFSKYFSLLEDKTEEQRRIFSIVLYIGTAFLLLDNLYT